MIRLYNCQRELFFTSVREACQVMGFSEATLYNRQLPTSWGGYEWERIKPQSKRHITCTRCGVTKLDTEFYKSAKQSENPKKPTRVNQPCKQCIKQSKQTKENEELYDPAKSRRYYAY